tara:strand:+ start:93 stop:608 length:516 start_codon:yes stop_codon:yes gene_type:complete
MNIYPIVVITEEMIKNAKELIEGSRVHRTIASPIDTLTGHLGEFVFAEYYFGNWQLNNVGKNKGQSDFKDIEVKASAFPFSERLNLLVREDYAKKRKPDYYVQIIIDVSKAWIKDIEPNTKAYVCGWATAEEVDKAPLRDMGSKYGGRGGYRCHYINIKNLNAIHKLKEML